LPIDLEEGFGCDLFMSATPRILGLRPKEESRIDPAGTGPFAFYAAFESPKSCESKILSAKRVTGMELTEVNQGLEISAHECRPPRPNPAYGVRIRL
jgi:hypothetical protein